MKDFRDLKMIHLERSALVFREFAFGAPAIGGNDFCTFDIQRRGPGISFFTRQADGFHACLDPITGIPSILFHKS